MLSCPTHSPLDYSPPQTARAEYPLLFRKVIMHNNAYACKTGMVVSAALQELVQVALQISDIVKLTAFASPTVIT